MDERAIVGLKKTVWVNTRRPAVRVGLGSFDADLGPLPLPYIELLMKLKQPTELGRLFADTRASSPEADLTSFVQQLLELGCLAAVPHGGEGSTGTEAYALGGQGVAVCCEDSVLAAAVVSSLKAHRVMLATEPAGAAWIIFDGPGQTEPHQAGIFVSVTESTLQVGPSFKGQYVPEWLGLTSPRQGARPSLAELAADLVLEELRARFSNLNTHVDRGALMLDLATKQFTFVRVPGTVENTSDAFAQIAQLYRRERRLHSPNALVVDPYLERLARRMPAGKVLDIGAGTGEASLLFAHHGHEVTALEPSEAMAQALMERLKQEGQSRICLVRGTAEAVELGEWYDLILLNMVLDHVEDCAQVLQRCHDALAAGGRLVVVVPHPFKDSGSWEERFVNGQQYYLGLTVRNYFYEGPMIKARYARDGEVVVPAVRSFKRGLGFYFAALRAAGFSVAELLEPSAPGDAEGSSHHAKASQVPYFLIFECTKESREND